jgi:hypothetical protein
MGLPNGQLALLGFPPSPLTYIGIFLFGMSWMELGSNHTMIYHRHARANLPKYAVPIFLRLVSEPLSTGNHKQNKVPLKAEGVDPDKVSSGDVIYWIRGDSYVPFLRADWEGLSQGRARL